MYPDEPPPGYRLLVHNVDKVLPGDVYYSEFFNKWAPVFAEVGYFYNVPYTKSKFGDCIHARRIKTDDMPRECDT